MTAKVLIYTKPTCPYCIKAKQLLNTKGVNFTEICIITHPEKRDEMIEKSKRNTVPQIFINDQSIGGCDDLHILEQNGELNILLGV
jgi:glutaredoxin 3